MNRSEILSQVYDAILHRPANSGIWWYLCFIDGKIQCLPMATRPIPEIIFRRMTTQQLGLGFTSPQWSELEGRIYTFLKDKGICKV